MAGERGDPEAMVRDFCTMSGASPEVVRAALL